MASKRQLASAAAAAARIPNVTTAVPAGGVSGARAGFMDGTDGRPSAVWARYSQPFGMGWSAMSGAPYAVNYESRERRTVAAVANDFATSNALIATAIETLLTQLVGTGLTLSAKVDAAQTGLTADEARVLSHSLESAFRPFARNPLECDATGRNTLDELALAFTRSYLLHGEGLAALDWQLVPGGRYGSKVALLDPRQLAADQTTSNGEMSVREGVAFNSRNQLTGYCIRSMTIGSASANITATFVAARTSWGRTRVIHLFEIVAAGQVRGVSPLAAALTPALEKRTLGEFTLSSALIGTMVAATVESDVPSNIAMGGLRTGDDFGMLGESQLAGDYVAAWNKERDDWYSGAPISLKPGVISHTFKGDKFKLNRVESPNNTFEAFDRTLIRSTARAAGESYEGVSGDYSMTSFSASRMASAVPHRLAMRRRKIIVERFYQSVYAAWVEEAIETGVVKLPSHAAPFHQAMGGYVNAEWRGIGMIQPDPKKAAEADALEVKHGFATWEQKLAERGLDLEDTVEAIERENVLRKKAGLLPLNFEEALKPENGVPPGDEPEGDGVPVLRRMD